MTKIKIGFYIEVDNKGVVHELIEHSTNRKFFNVERDLAIQVTKLLNTLYVEENITSESWKDLENLKNEDARNLSVSLKEKFNL